jgi:hypothetical protein
MKVMSAADAKNSFGLFLDTIQHEPVVVTKKNRSVGLMLSMQDVETLFGGDEKFVSRALEEARIDKRINHARQQSKKGLGVAADATFFDMLRTEIRASAKKK